MKKGMLVILGLLVVISWFSLIGSCQSEKINMAGWKTYAGEIFSIKYPPSWEITRPFSPTLVLDGKTEGNIKIGYRGTDLNFGDGDINDPNRLKLGLDQFMGWVKNNDAFQNMKKTRLNNYYNAYEIDFCSKVSDDGGKTYHELNIFAIMTKDNKGQIVQISFNNRSTRSELTPTELQIISSFRFTDHLYEPAIKIKFDSRQWKSALLYETDNVRYKMHEDLIDKYKLTGMTKKEIVELLGPVQSHRFFCKKWDLCYWMGRRSMYSSEIIWLVMKLRDNKVAEYQIMCSSE